MTEFSPVRGQGTAHAPDQQHQLSPVHAVPREGGQQEELENGRHRCARALVPLHVLVRVRQDVAISPRVCGFVVRFAGVVNPKEEGEDEGQQGDVDAQQGDLGVAVLWLLP